ncbi:MAG: hypothetical protein Q9175_003142 [Cornicularia normoerica]
MTKSLKLTDPTTLQKQLAKVEGKKNVTSKGCPPKKQKANTVLDVIGEDGGARAGQERFLVLTTPDSYKAHVKGMIKGTYKHNFTIGQIHIDEFHNTKSDTAATPTLISDYKKEQLRIVLDDPDNIKGKHESKSNYHERMKSAYKAVLPYVCGYPATPWSKSFNDMAAMVGAIEQPWWVGLTNVESHNKKAQSDDSDHSSIDPSLLDDKLLVQLELNQGDLNLPEADIFPVEFAATDWPEQELMSSTGLDETACNEQAFSEKSA